VLKRLLIGLLFVVASAWASAASRIVDNLPAQFVANQGQWSEAVHFAARKGGLSAAFEPHTIRLHDSTRAADALVLRFEGAAQGTRIVGEKMQPGRQHFYVGNDPTQWRTDVPAYAALLYQGLYRGVDLRVREERGLLEYDLLLAPGAELGRVVVRTEGVVRIESGADGSLLLHTAAGVLRQSAPKTWEQLADGSTRPLAARFRIIDAQRYGFEAPGRDTRLALVVDPGLEWSTLLGASFPEWVYGVQRARDGSNDILVAGVTSSTDFLGSSFPANAQRVFVTRLSADGRTLLYTTYISGNAVSGTYLGAMAADASGGAAIVGSTSDPTFPATPGAYQTALRGNSDAYVARLSASGALMFSSFLGGSGDDAAAFASRGVGFEPSGAVVVAGGTLSTDFPTTIGAYDRSYSPPVVATDSGLNDFVARLSANGSQLSYGSFFGGPNGGGIKALIVDPTGYVMFTGTTGAGLPVTAGAFDTSYNAGGEDTFITRMKLDGAGAADLRYSSYLGGNNRDQGLALAFDPANPELVTMVGWTYQDALSAMTFPITAGVYKPVLAPHAATSPLFPHVQNGFVTRWRFPAAGGGSLVWSTFIGASDWSHATGVAIDESGGAIVLGGTRFHDFPTTRGAYDRTIAGPIWGSTHDCFVARLTSTGTQVPYATLLGGAADECDIPNLTGWSHIAYLGANKVVVVDETKSADFPTTPGAFDTSYANGPAGFSPTSDIFISKLDLVADASGDVNVDTPVLSAPANGVFLGALNSVTLSWNAVADPSGIEAYNYQMSSRPDFPASFIQQRGTVTTTSFTDNDIARITWYWRVQAADRAGNLSAWSPAFTFTLGTPLAPTVAPSLLAPASGAAVALPVAFDWGDVAGATGYEMEVDDASSFGAPLLASVTSTVSNTSLSSLPAGTLWWRVRASNTGGIGPWSAARSFTIGGTPPPPPPSGLPAPSLLSPANQARFNQGQTINFDWSDVAGAVSYEIQIDNSSGFSLPLTHTASPVASAYATSTLPRQTLYWRVRALASGGAVGAWSSVRRLEVR
jgi:hypothetical protein